MVYRFVYNKYKLNYHVITLESTNSLGHKYMSVYFPAVAYLTTAATIVFYYFYSYFVLRYTRHFYYRTRR